MNADKNEFFFLKIDAVRSQLSGNVYFVGYILSIYQMAVQKLSERLVFRGYCAEGILYP